MHIDIHQYREDWSTLSRAHIILRRGLYPAVLGIVVDDSMLLMVIDDLCGKKVLCMFYKKIFVGLIHHHP